MVANQQVHGTTGKVLLLRFVCKKVAALRFLNGRPSYHREVFRMGLNQL